MSVRILAISGSRRRDFINRCLLAAATRRLETSGARILDRQLALGKALKSFPTESDELLPAYRRHVDAVTKALLAPAPETG